MFKEIIENDALNINSKKIRGKFFFDNNKAFDRPLWTASRLIDQDNVYLYFLYQVILNLFNYLKKCRIQHSGYYSIILE